MTWREANKLWNNPITYEWFDLLRSAEYNVCGENVNTELFFMYDSKDEITTWMGKERQGKHQYAKQQPRKTNANANTANSAIDSNVKKAE